ncbi:hypothetical protein QVD17_28364 [Tagetes erecta]|uniref:Uncharacterized protein n=1 Tax=Tagetes erecta TaxID=13708 RepID=A0AAD8KEX5_TARER|nr:hypothetical protein QVD17_28364 [Tagetes erecta]
MIWLTLLLSTSFVPSPWYVDSPVSPFFFLEWQDTRVWEDISDMEAVAKIFEHEKDVENAAHQQSGIATDMILLSKLSQHDSASECSIHSKEDNESVSNKGSITHIPIKYKKMGNEQVVSKHRDFNRPLY